MSTPAQDQLIAAIQSRFGPKTAMTDPDAIAPWVSDWRGRWHGATPAILSPGSTEEVAAIVRLARDAGVALVPQGETRRWSAGRPRPPTDRR